MNPWPASLAVAALLASGCASRSSLPGVDIETARQSVAQATAHPYAERAAGEVELAQQALQRAERAWVAARKRDEVRHLAYLAQRRAEIALAVAARAQSEQQPRAAPAPATAR